MKIVPMSNATFNGLWRESKKVINAQEKTGVDYFYVQKQTYHPFKDEVVSDEIKSMEGIKGVKYYEYNGDDDNFGNEHSSIAVQIVEVGEKLDITQDEYDILLEIQARGIAASKALEKIGKDEFSKFDCSKLTSGFNDSVMGVKELEKSLISGMISKLDLNA